jgi:hypothetical protein
LGISADFSVSSVLDVGGYHQPLDIFQFVTIDLDIPGDAPKAAVIRCHFLAPGIREDVKARDMVSDRVNNGEGAVVVAKKPDWESV